MSIKVTPQGIQLDSNLIPLYSGAVHYWRLERTLWKAILENVKEMGFQVIETYIPWSVHETASGVFDFGTNVPEKDLDAFLTLCEELDLFVHVRPGPHINSEMTYFGFPRRIVHDKAIQARSPFGTPVNLPHSPKIIPIPSYASHKFYQEVAVYFDALAPILRKHAYPTGNIIAVQSDNETCYFFRERPYMLDYHPDSIQLYQNMLTAKYTEIDDLNQIYHSDFLDFHEVMPPTGFQGTSKEDLPRHLDWVEYKEYQICWCLRRFADMWRERGINLPFYQNTGYHYYTPLDNIRIEKECLDICGIDMYPNKTSHKTIKEKVRYMSGSSILPFVPEYGSGVWYEFPQTFLPEEEEFTTLYAFMNGLKAINFYMLVERDRWQGSPITRDNRIRKEYFSFYKKLLSFFSDNKIWEFFRAPKVLVLKNYDCARVKAALSYRDFASLDANTFTPAFNLPPALFAVDNRFDFQHFDEDSSHWASEFWIEHTISVLEDLHIDFNISDSHLPYEDLLSYDYIFASAYDFMSEKAQQALSAYAESGRTLILGPGMPVLNMSMRSCMLLKEAAAVKQVHLVEHITPNFVKTLEIPVLFTTQARDIEIVCQHNKHTMLLWIANKTDEPKTFELCFEGTFRFQPKYNARFYEGNGTLTLTMPAYSISVWEVQS